MLGLGRWFPLFHRGHFVDIHTRAFHVRHLLREFEDLGLA